MTPNEGIGHSRRSALISAIGVGLLFGLVDGLLFGVPMGVLFGLFFGLKNGGLTVSQHYILRFLLVRYGYAPWNYVAFLDSCAERILLRKVGGGYIFVHRLLLEYFASLDQSTKETP